MWPATTHCSTLPICQRSGSIYELWALTPSVSLQVKQCGSVPPRVPWRLKVGSKADRKSTRLNSSHSQISYAVFCLKKKKKKNKQNTTDKKQATEPTGHTHTH